MTPFIFHSRTGKTNLWWKISEWYLFQSCLGQRLTEKGHEGIFQGDDSVLKHNHGDGWLHR